MKSPVKMQVAAVALVLAVGLVGCAASSDSDEPTPDSTATSTADSETSNDVIEVDPDASGATDAGIDLDNPPEAIAAVEVPIQADLYDRNVESSLLEVVKMRHVEDALVITFRVTITGEGAGVEPLRLWDALGGQFSPALIDYKNLVRYDDVHDLSTSTEIRALAGQPLYAVATFAYPEDADEVDVIVNPDLPAIAAVPVP
ncbi:hypothetical protein LG299_12715 [Microbacterium lacus]|uniref:hypothetical protein n=1 Tax=Microbacterium lacus TaxID=415217 RepID=UPI00384F502B